MRHAEGDRRVAQRSGSPLRAAYGAVDEAMLGVLYVVGGHTRRIKGALGPLLRGGARYEEISDSTKRTVALELLWQREG
jgi:hypothetical protein